MSRGYMDLPRSEYVQNTVILRLRVEASILDLCFIPKEAKKEAKKEVIIKA
ncbi:hypothetical protein [Myroides guanonis]|uniref:hypothetical protein n=1 Tax=Myroides guanonis TaxID=1150112 RepID=UPI001C42ECDD|nr:hypothetical protein [Myroides guanonis]